MAKEKEKTRTNVMRVLESAGAEYEAYFADVGKTVPPATELAALLGKEKERVFKTLVTVGTKSGEHYVFVIPSDRELDLKKAARAVGDKAVEMLKQKDLLPLTGYVHGGCSPIGMKKQFVTVFHKTASDFETILFSAGKIGVQVETSLADVGKVIPFTLNDICF